MEKAGTEPLGHYLTEGWKQGCRPHPLFDPDWYLGKIGVADTGACLGVRQLQERIREEFPEMKFGYFNPPIERIRGRFETDFAHH